MGLFYYLTRTFGFLVCESNGTVENGNVTDEVMKQIFTFVQGHKVGEAGMLGIALRIGYALHRKLMLKKLEETQRRLVI